ncbi:MAG TPA: hypothetical protein PKO06_15460, partial [Candidatus Ozemobacteraceae bacterium]|nr:hypothetical protein [Candidatus Ozemobacteraceae bacterium]
MTPEIWEASPAGSGNAVIQSSATPASATVRCSHPVSFQASYIPVTVTAPGSWFYLHGAGTPTRLASGTSLADATPWPVSDSLSTGIRIYEEKLTVTPTPLHLGTVNPGSLSAPKNLTVTNTGNLDLEHVDWEMHNLSTDAYFIPYNAILMNPDPVGGLAIATAMTCSASVLVPPATPPGTYSALQFAFEDNDQNGNSMEEAIGQFDMQVHVPSVQKLQVGTTSIFLGSWLANDTTATHTALISNIGNRSLSVVRLLVSDFLLNGTDATRRIASSNVQLNPIAIGYMVAGESRWQALSVKVIPSPLAATGTFIATGTFFNDADADAQVDPGEASATMQISLIIGPSESFTVTPVPVNLGTRLPGELTVSSVVYASNTGGLPLENLRFEVATMSETTGDVISPQYISMAPDPLPVVGIGASTSFQVFINIPFGAKESVGGHDYGEQLPQSYQYLYNDKNKNGIRDTGEAATPFQCLVKVGITASFTVSEEIANFGTGLPGETLTTTVDVISIGNDKCQKMKWLVTGNSLTSGPNSIPFTPGAATIEPYEAAGWLLDVPPATTHQLATLTLAIPLGTPVGVYTGRCRLYNDTIGPPWNTYNAGEPTDEFDLRVEVGARGLDILDSSPFPLGIGIPASETAPAIFSVKNTGQRTLNDLKYQKPTLTSGGNTIPAANLLYSLPDPIGLLNAGAIWAPSVRVSVPPNQEAGIYADTLYVYQDDDHDGIMDAVEIRDSLDFTLEVQLKRILQFAPSPLDMGGINKGQTVTRTVLATNLGNRPLNTLCWEIPDLKDGGNLL